jgi:hypothetical protein
MPCGSMGRCVPGMASRPLRSRLILIALLGVASLATAAAPASAAPVTTASCLPVSVGDGVVGDPGILVESSQTLAQSFRASRAGTLTRADLALEKVPGTTDPLAVALWSFDRLTGQPVTMLDSASVAAASVRDAAAGDPGLSDVSFGGGIPIAQGSDYALVLSTAANGDIGSPGVDPHFYVFREAQNPCPYAGLWYSQTGSFLSATSSGAFTVTVDAASSDSPGNVVPVPAHSKRKCKKRKKRVQHKTRKCKRQHRLKH